MIRGYLEERYRGVKPVLWGDALKELEFTCWLYQDLMGLGPEDEDAT